MAYTEASLIIGGALDEFVEFSDPVSLTHWLSAVMADTTAPDFTESAEVYLIHHDHYPAECECVQYLCDHSPYWTNGQA